MRPQGTGSASAAGFRSAAAWPTTSTSSATGSARSRWRCSSSTRPAARSPPRPCSSACSSCRPSLSQALIARVEVIGHQGRSAARATRSRRPSSWRWPSIADNFLLPAGARAGGDRRHARARRRARSSRAAAAAVLTPVGAAAGGQRDLQRRLHGRRRARPAAGGTGGRRARCPRGAAARRRVVPARGAAAASRARSRRSRRSRAVAGAAAGGPRLRRGAVRSSSACWSHRRPRSSSSPRCPGRDRVREGDARTPATPGTARCSPPGASAWCSGSLVFAARAGRPSAAAARRQHARDRRRLPRDGGAQTAAGRLRGRGRRRARQRRPVGRP